MAEIEFKATSGDQSWDVELTHPFGAGNVWQIYVDKHYCGRIHEVGREYRYYDNLFLAEDVQAMVDRITEYKGEPTKLVVMHTAWNVLPGMDAFDVIKKIPG